jgi:hypothetical protein
MINLPDAVVNPLTSDSDNKEATIPSLRIHMRSWIKPQTKVTAVATSYAEYP